MPKIPLQFEEVSESQYVTAPSTGFEVLSSNFDLSLFDSPVMGIARMKAIDELASKSDKVIPVDELNEMYPGLPVPFKEPTNQFVAQHIADTQREKMRLQAVIESGPTGAFQTIGNFGAMMVAQALDPINVGAGFLSAGMFNYARGARVGLSGTEAFVSGAQQFQKLSPVRKLVSGIGDGFIGNVAVEPFIVHAARKDNSDYTIEDMFINSLAGAVIFPGLRFGVTKGVDLFRKLGPKVAETAHRSARAQLDNDKVVNLDPLRDDIVNETNGNVLSKEHERTIFTVEKHDGAIFYAPSSKKGSTIEDGQAIIHEDYGNLLYLTDNLDVANGAAGRKWSGSPGEILSYKLSQMNLIDLNTPLKGQPLTSFRNFVNLEIANRKAKKIKTKPGLTTLESRGVKHEIQKGPDGWRVMIFDEKNQVFVPKHNGYANLFSTKKQAIESIEGSSLNKIDLENLRGKDVLDSMRDLADDGLYERLHDFMVNNGFDGYHYISDKVMDQPHQPHNNIMAFKTDKLEETGRRDVDKNAIPKMSKQKYKEEINKYDDRKSDIDFDEEIHSLNKEMDKVVEKETKLSEQDQKISEQIEELEALDKMELLGPEQSKLLEEIKKAKIRKDVLRDALKKAFACLRAG
jgi:hypothetical protein